MIQGREWTGMDATERVERFVKKRTVVSRDRSEAARAVTIHVAADRRYFRCGTALIPAGGSDTVYLTETGLVGGETTFTEYPRVSVEQESSNNAGGVTRASSPMDPAVPITFQTPDNHRLEVSWLPANRIYAVKITNLDTAAHCYKISAEGF